MMGVSENRGLVVYHSSFIEMTIWEYTVTPYTRFSDTPIYISQLPIHLQKSLGSEEPYPVAPILRHGTPLSRKQPQGIYGLSRDRSPLAYSRPG